MHALQTPRDSFLVSHIYSCNLHNLGQLDDGSCILRLQSFLGDRLEYTTLECNKLSFQASHSTLKTTTIGLGLFSLDAYSGLGKQIGYAILTGFGVG